MTSLRLVFLHGFHDRGGGLGELHHDARDVADDFGEVAGGMLYESPALTVAVEPSSYLTFIHPDLR